MYKSILAALKSIKSNRYFSLINIVNLIVGFVCFILIAFWIKHEMSYDSFHQKADRIYRVAYTGVLFGKEVKDAKTGTALYDALKNDFPEVEKATIITNFGKPLLAKDDGVSFRVKLSGINPDFFDVFDVGVIEGDINDLSKPNTAFITQETATKFFGQENPIGKAVSTFMGRENKRFIIMGIVEKLPENSHLDYEMLYSNVSNWIYNRNNIASWTDASFYNYVVLFPNTDIQVFEEKFNAFALPRIAPIIQLWQNISMEEWLSKGDKIRFAFQPLKDIHLTPFFQSEYKPSGNVVYLYIFILIGILILLISVINFSNLSTVKSLSRSKEIGVRKTFGSSRRSLIIQFLVESCFLSLIALVISLIIISLIAPYYQNFTGIDIWSESNLQYWVFISFFIIALASGLLAGLYPAFYISKQSPIAALSFMSKPKFKGVLFKDVLIVLQFAISIMVIIGTFVISNQLNYLQNENLGFNKENILVIRGTSSLGWEKTGVLNKELQKINGVKQSTSSHFIPNHGFEDRGFQIENKSGIEKIMIDILPCDYNFQNVYQFKLVKGRFFDQSFSKESRKIVLNQKAAKLLNMDNLLGKTLVDPGRGNVKYEIIGVVEDFHYSSKETEILPMGMVQSPDINMFWSPGFCSVLMEGDQTQTTIAQIKKVCDNVTPGSDFNYSFFSDDYDNIYRQEMIIKKLFILFSFIALSLSCFGLFGFVKYLVQVRTKEIGVRKVNGASNSSIFVLLSKYFTRPIIIAMILAFPIVYYLAHRWLENFAYRINLQIYYFVLAGLLTAVIVFLTVGFIALKAARRNPIEALRYE